LERLKSPLWKYQRTNCGGLGILTLRSIIRCKIPNQKVLFFYFTYLFFYYQCDLLEREKEERRDGERKNIKEMI
jgi:hypothetical protein